MDKVLKQRLVGASILIALAVIFLPMLFDGGDAPGDDRRRMAVDVPAREPGEQRVRRLALDPESARQPPADAQAQSPTRPEPSRAEPPQPVESQPRTVEAEQPAQSSTAEGQTGGEDEPAAEVQSVAAEESEEAVAEPAPSQAPAEAEPEPETSSETPAQPETEATPPPAEAGRWVVQVAVFSSRDTAATIRQRLIDLGHRVSMDVLVRDQAELFRLRTGPYASEGDAERARGQIAATVAGVQPVTRELSGGAGGEDRTGLVVQVGSFASNNNAERLVGQLSSAGYDAFMYGEESGGRTIWRVRVGGYDSREEAEELLETLRSEQGLDGIVVSHP